MNRRTSPGSPAARSHHGPVLFADLDHLDARSSPWWTDPFAQPPPPLYEEARDALRSRLETALSTALSPRQREVVELTFFHGRSQGEVARTLGITQQVVHKCLYGVTRNGRPIGGALRRLREALGEV